MPFPLAAYYPWGHTKESRKLHFHYAPREHEDLETIARILNQLSVEAVPGQNYAELVRQGDRWIIRVPGPWAPAPIAAAPGPSSQHLDMREVSVCVAGVLRKMLVYGSEPY